MESSGLGVRPQRVDVRDNAVRWALCRELFVSPAREEDGGDVHTHLLNQSSSSAGQDVMPRFNGFRFVILPFLSVLLLFCLCRTTTIFYNCLFSSLFLFASFLFSIIFFCLCHSSTSPLPVKLMTVRFTDWPSCQGVFSHLPSWRVSSVDEH